MFGKKRLWPLSDRQLVAFIVLIITTTIVTTLAAWHWNW